MLAAGQWDMLNANLWLLLPWTGARLGWVGLDDPQDPRESPIFRKQHCKPFPASQHPLLPPLRWGVEAGTWWRRVPGSISHPPSFPVSFPARLFSFRHRASSQGHPSNKAIWGRKRCDALEGSTPRVIAELRALEVGSAGRRQAHEPLPWEMFSASTSLCI